MAQLEFVNRSQEIDTLTSDIHVETNLNRVVILKGGTGIGKSRLSQRILQLITTRPSVKLSLRTNRTNLAQDGHFLRSLAIELDERSREDIRIPSFKSFLRTKGQIKTIGKQAVKNTSKALMNTNVVTKTILAVKDGVNIPVSSARKQFLEPTADNTILSFDYLSHVCEHSSPIINIENIQSIDESSLQLLESMLNIQSGQYLLLEYTDDREDLWSINDIKEGFGTNSKVSYFPVERLKVEDVLKIIKKQPEALESLVRNLYLDSNGSLRPLTDFYIRAINNPEGLAIEAHNNSFTKLDDFTFSNLNEIDNSSQFVLVAMAIHGGWIEIDLLRMLSDSELEEFLFLIDVETSIDDLVERSIIEVDERRYKITDNIIDFVTNQGFYIRNKTIAIHSWKNIYSKIALERNDIFVPKAQAYHYLVYFSFLEGDTFECVKFLDQALYLAVRSFAPSRILVFIKDIRNRLRKTTENNLLTLLLNVDKKIISALQTLSYNEDALEIANQLPDCEERTFFRSILLENIGRAKDALTLIEEKTNSPKKAIDLIWKLRFELSKFAALRALLRYSECKSLFENMYKNKKYKELVEFGYVCRCAGSCLEYSEAIPYIRESVDIFEKQKVYMQEAYSRIELSVMLVDVAEIEEARKQLNIAEKLLDGQISERHTIMNNKASLSICDDSVSQVTLSNLRQAFLTAQTGFDKTAIRNNQLISLSILNHASAKDAVEETLECCERGGFTSRELVCITLHNAIVYFLLNGDTRRAKELDLKLESIKKQIEKNWLPDLNVIEPTNSSSLKKLFEPVFLSNWSLELSGSETVVY